MPFTVTGEVIRGKQLGSKLGFPTANIRYDMRRNAWPAEGVYAGVACVRDALYLCVLNQGKHPTSPEGVPTVEAHLLDYAGGALYGETITLEYLSYLRPEQVFPSLDALREQLALDKQAARDWAADHPTLLDSRIQKERS
ncbi:MAG: FMN adenylyltransferase [Clostridiales bacterium]|nr:FMN adenylyltransferase [Clostridiales bacterium]